MNMAKDRLKGRKTLQVSNFLDEFEKDDIKKDVDIVRLFERFGVVLTKKGKSYLGLCPWHDDSTPSLSVDREKGLYNCFGCGESGDVFTLTEKMKGMSFRESAAWLKDFAGKNSIQNKNDGPLTLAPPSTIRKSKNTKESELEAQNSESEI
jgi:DNA primase